MDRMEAQPPDTSMGGSARRDEGPSESLEREGGAAAPPPGSQPVPGGWLTLRVPVHLWPEFYFRCVAGNSLPPRPSGCLPVRSFSKP